MHARGLRLVSAWLLFSVGCGQGSAKPTPAPPPEEPAEPPVVNGRGLRRDPPQVQSMEAMLLDKGTSEGNALLMVRFAQSGGLPASVTADPDGRRVLLRDDGKGGDVKAQDGLFSAVFRLDVARLAARQKELAAITSREQLSIPVFDGRSLGKPIPLPAFDIDK